MSLVSWGGVSCVLVMMSFGVLVPVAGGFSQCTVKWFACVMGNLMSFTLL